MPLLHQALKAISDTVAGGGRVLFVGTKRQATEAIAEAAKRSAQYYINHRWLGGTLTNWKTISNSINTMNDLDKLIEEKGANFNKKELLSLSRKRDNLELALGGIKDMGGHPNLIFIVDTVKEKLAVAEARHLGIPVVAVVDSNSDPDPIDYPIPGNDDAIRAIDLYCDLAAKAAIDGLSRAQINAGVDIGASEIAPQEQLDDMITGDESNAGKDQANDGSSGVDNSTQEVVSDAGAKPDSKIKPEVIAESETPAEKKSESAANDDTPAASTQADSVSEEAKASTK